MRDKGLDQEISKGANNRLDLLLLTSSGLDPRSGFRPGLVEGKQPALASSLDQLVWFGDEFHAGGQQPWVGGFRSVEYTLVVGTFREIDGGKLGRRVVCPRGLERRGFDDGGASKVVADNGLAVSFVNGFGGHGRDEDRKGVMAQRGGHKIN